MFWTFLSRSIRFSTIFLYGSTGEIITEKSGHLNLGVPGVMCIGAVGGCLGINAYLKTLGSAADMSAFGVVIIGILCALLAGALAGLLFSFFTVTLRCNQNVTGLTLTTFGAAFMKFMLGDLENSSSVVNLGTASRAFTQSMLPSEPSNWFEQLFLSYGVLVYLAIAIAIAAAIILKRTRTGLNLRAVGENPATADAAGISVGKYRYLSTILGCAIAALGGLFYIMDSLGGALEFTVDAYGWMAVALVIFSIWKPNWAILGSILFGALYIAPNYLLNLSFSEKEIIKLLPYIVTVLVLIITSIFGKRSVQPPAALGTTYFREER